MNHSPSNKRRPISGVSSSMLNSAVEIAQKQHPYEKELNRINPYTQERITDETSYLRYLREHCYYDFCDQRITAAKAESEKNIKTHRQRFRIVFFLLVVLLFALIVTFIVSGKKIKASYENGLTSGYQSGYDVGVSEGYDSGYSKGRTDGFVDGKEQGYDIGYSDGASSAKSTYNSGSGSHRDSPISDGYIGNRNTHKYHLSTCSYLPDQKNQVVFDSPEEAEASGYVPCAKCNP